MKFCLALSISAMVVAGTAEASKWEVISKDDGITVYQKDQEGSPVVSLRGETVIYATPAQVFAIMKNNSLSSQWVPMVAEKRDLKPLAKNERLEYTHIDMPWPLDDRYFINRAKVEYLKDGRIKAFIRSVENPSYKDDDKVLGFLHYSEFMLTPYNGGLATHMKIEVNSDPKGMIPKWLVNAAQRDWPIDFFTGLKRMLKERGQLRLGPTKSGALSRNLGR